MNEIRKLYIALINLLGSENIDALPFETSLLWLSSPVTVSFFFA